MSTQDLRTNQYLLTVSAGKRLIAKAVAAREDIKKALKDHTIAMGGGTTNGYIAEELFKAAGQLEDFSKYALTKGVSSPPGKKVEAKEYGGDVILEKGKRVFGKNMVEAVTTMGPGDIVIKGANAIDRDRKMAGILIGGTTLGSTGAVMSAVIGRRTGLIIAAGLEKRVTGNISDIAAKLNAPTTTGLRMAVLHGAVVTELEAVENLTGATAELVAAGGVYGAEGCSYIAVTGTEAQLKAAAELIKSVAEEPAF